MEMELSNKLGHIQIDIAKHVQICMFNQCGFIE